MTRQTTPVTFTFDGRDGTTVTAYRWEPGGDARAVVQLTHGMGEHVLRYGHLADALTGAGFLVVGQDHRGHGASAASPAEQGQIGADGWAGLVDDIDVLVGRSHDEHPDLPLVLLGHSMGSFAVQQYLLDHSEDVTAAVLTGTAALNLLEPALDLDKPIDLAMFNAPFAPARTDFDWLSRDESQVDAYIADPGCGFGLDTAAGKALFAGARDAGDPARLAAIRPDLPLYIAVGDKDPVNGQLALVNALVDRYQVAGLTDITLVTYPDARHEIFNETNRAEVEAGLIAWLDQVVPR
ncbi:alpha/beta fold hydrolase [Pseudonocardia sp. GCM10023141]|uniref:alpha/beta fold hydrolase n=1 Tax=Pseudonocardia sp. GCM10023141 TaxID=3252653 RepID=UPI00360B1351